jgi:hypothetical protein
MTDKSFFIEEIIINSVQSLLIGRVNELLAETKHSVPPLEFGNYRGGSAVVGASSPVVALAACERTEKERLIRLDTYALTITFVVPEGVPFGSPNGNAENQGFSAICCYAYAWAVEAALREDPTLGGIAGRAVLTGKKYAPPKQSGTGGEWTVVLTARIVVEGMGNDN